MSSKRQGNKSMPTRKTAKTAPKPTRKRKGGRRTLHHILLVVLLLIVGVVLSLTVFFKVENIAVTGIDDYYDSNEIISTSGLELESNLFLAPTKEVPQLLIDKYPYIEQVNIRRSLPPTITIEVAPSVVSAALKVDDEYALITESGKILERGLILVPADVILVSGIDIGDKVPGDYLGVYIPEEIDSNATDSQKNYVKSRNEMAQQQAETESDCLSTIEYMKEAINNTSFEGITNLDLSDPLNMKVMYENRLLLKLGTELDLEYKLKFIKASLDLLGPDAHGEILAENPSEKAQLFYRPAEGYDRDGYLIHSKSPDEDDKDDIDSEDDKEKTAEDKKAETKTDIAPAKPESSAPQSQQPEAPKPESTQPKESTPKESSEQPKPESTPPASKEETPSSQSDEDTLPDDDQMEVPSDDDLDYTPPIVFDDDDALNIPS